MPVPHQWKRLFSGSAPEFLRPDVARDLVNTEKAVVLDVREEYEFAEGHASVAVNISVTELKDRMHEVAKLVADRTDAPIVVYCRYRAALPMFYLFLNGIHTPTNPFLKTNPYAGQEGGRRRRCNFYSRRAIPECTTWAASYMRLRHLFFMARAAPSVLRRKLRSNVTCRAQLTRGPSSYFRADATGTPHLAITAAAAPVAPWIAGPTAVQGQGYVKVSR